VPLSALDSASLIGGGSTATFAELFKNPAAGADVNRQHQLFHFNLIHAMSRPTFDTLLMSAWARAASMILNIVLLAALCWVWMRPEKRMAEAPAQTAAETTATAGPTPKAQAAAPVFHWSQLDAADFATFVKNLRDIGCPEATIRDIVRGELREIYAEKRQEIEQGATMPARDQKLRLQRLAQEESALVATLTGLPGDGGANAAVNDGEAPQAAAPGGEAAPVTADASTFTPAAFLVGNAPGQDGHTGGLSPTANDPRLNAATAEVINQMRDQFAHSLEGAGSDAASPIYRQRWRPAQRASDEIFSSMFGGDYYIRTQIEASQTTAAGAQTR